MSPRTGRWLLRNPPEDGAPLLVCFPYGGTGASFYYRWPPMIAGLRVCLLQPPGRENRLREPTYATYEEFAEDLTGFLRAGGYLDRPYAFIGHCGGVPLALQTILRLEESGLPLPQRLISSSWGAPHRGLYGPLMVVDIERYDFEREVKDRAVQLGKPIPDDLASLSARILRDDLVALRNWQLYDASHTLPVPISVVAWTDDEIVPPADALPGWEECGAVTSDLLDGDHLAFVTCPPALRAVITRDLVPA